MYLVLLCYDCYLGAACKGDIVTLLWFLQCVYQYIRTSHLRLVNTILSKPFLASSCDANIYYDERMTLVNFGSQMSMFKVTVDKYLNKLVDNIHVDTFLVPYR